MDIKPTNIERYRFIIDKKINRYKKRRKNIWNIHYEKMKEFMYNKIKKSERNDFQDYWYKLCLWEMKYQPSINNKLSYYSKKLEDRMEIYYFIINKIAYTHNLNNDSIMCIIQFIF